LNEEYRKEFYAEGQYFWFLKTHGLVGKLKHKESVTLTEESFIFPLPDAEKEYGWVETGNNAENENNNGSESEGSTEEATPEV
jgi:hypothetical protein